ncbi:hypothetical protein ABIB40_001419 [Pedobacter sp. UYP30]|uniref:DUF4349 domain-containing protein n=1 Tax=Pedobacter sp. UYP30 TaxID=1756400 RepID=UPI0033962DF9
MKRNLIALAMLLTVLGCQNAKRGSQSQDQSLESANLALDDTTAVAKIIKTADMNFRVKDVQATKIALSKDIRAAGGQLVGFEIQSSIRKTEKVRQSLDSLKEITAYRTEGSLTAKIPADQLDEFTNSVAKLAVFINSQSLKMDDQSLNYLANKLKAQNNANATTKIDALTKKKRVDVQSALVLNDNSVDRKIENMQINQLVKFSTITLAFYQDNTIQTMMVANDNLADYRPSFFNRLWLNVVDGWGIFKEIILVLANIWVFILMALGLMFGIKYYNARRRLSKIA